MAVLVVKEEVMVVVLKAVDSGSGDIRGDGRERY